MNDNKVSVALLLSDLQEVKVISNVFKKLGVIPHFYEDLKTFWHGTLERLPAICIVDVKMMSEGELVLRDHPAVIADEMPLLFYYTDATEPLLVSTHQFYHLGVLKKSPHYEGALKAILKRLNKVSALEQHYHMLTLTTKAQKDQIEKLELVIRDDRKADQYQSMVKNVCLELEKYKTESDFFKALEKVFQGVDEIEEFAFLELSFNGQKLISPLSHSAKFRSIPSLWLGQACQGNIEVFAQNMATQVSLEVMGGDLVSLLIRGNDNQVEKMIFVKAKNELFFNNFDWNMLEAYLSGFYASFKNKLMAPISLERKFASTYEALTYVDQFLFGQSGQSGESISKNKKEDMRLVDLDLGSLIASITKKGTTRFFWSRFYHDFIHKLEIQTRVDFRFFEYGAGHIGFVVKAGDQDLFFDHLKDFSNRFSYWKYFEDSEAMLTMMIKPKVTMSPMSAHAYITKVSGSQSNKVETETIHSKETRSTPTLKKEKDQSWSFLEPKNNFNV